MTTQTNAFMNHLTTCTDGCDWEQRDTGDLCPAGVAALQSIDWGAVTRNRLRDQATDESVRQQATRLLDRLHNLP